MNPDGTSWTFDFRRKAINLSINRDELCAAIFGGECGPAVQWLWPDSNASAKLAIEKYNLTPYPYDPDESRRLLKEAGYAGDEVKILTYLNPGMPEGIRFLEAIAG